MAESLAVQAILHKSITRFAVVEVDANPLKRVAGAPSAFMGITMNNTFGELLSDKPEAE
jgi:hypothetical protein